MAPVCFRNQSQIVPLLRDEVGAEGVETKWTYQLFFPALDYIFSLMLFFSQEILEPADLQKRNSII